MALGLVCSVGITPDDTCGYVVSSDDNVDCNVEGGNRICEGEHMEDKDWFYHLFQYPGNQCEKGRTSDEPEHHSTGSDEDDTTNAVFQAM